MNMRASLITVFLALVLAVLTCGVDQSRAQSGKAAETISGTMADSLRQRAERVQERRKGRITQAQREAAAARAKAARAKSAPVKSISSTGEKGGLNE